MAKNPAHKPSPKPEPTPADAPSSQPEAGTAAAVETPSAVAAPPAVPKPAESNTPPSPKKDASITSKLKKPAGNTAKPSSMLPSAHKLEHLKAAVNFAGGTENLLAILHHVDEAGGRAEVADSIEAYRVLKTVLDETAR